MKKGDTKAPRYAKNVAELAVCLGVTKTTVASWKRNPKYKNDLPIPRADGRLPILEWQTFMEKNALSMDNKKRSELEESVNAKIEYDKLRVEEKRIKIDLLKEEYVRRAIVKESFARNLSRLFTKLQRGLTNEIPAQLEGLTAGEISKKLDMFLATVIEDAEKESLLKDEQEENEQ